MDTNGYRLGQVVHISLEKADNALSADKGKAAALHEGYDEWIALWSVMEKQQVTEKEAMWQGKSKNCEVQNLPIEHLECMIL